MGISPLAQRRCQVKGWRMEKVGIYYYVWKINPELLLSVAKGEHDALRLAKEKDK